MNKKTAKWIGQIFITVLLLYISFQKVDLNQIKNIVYDLYYVPFIFIPFLLIADLTLNSYRIVSLYRFYGIKSNIKDVVKIKLVGNFFALVFPLVGDLYKIQAFKKTQGSSYKKNVVIVFLDRLIFAFGLTIILAPVIAFGIILKLNPVIVYSILFLLVIEVIIFYLINNPVIVLTLYNRLKQSIPFLKLEEINFNHKKGYYREILFNTIIAIGRHFIGLLTFFCVAIAIYKEIPFSFFAFSMVVFFLMLSRVIPVSIGGMGVREYIAVMIFPQIGINENYAFSIAFIVSTIMLLFGLSGGLFYLKQVISRKE